MPRKKITKEKKEKTEKIGELKDIKFTASKQEIYWILGAMAGLILLILIISSLMHSSNTFTYQTLKFTKTKYGELPVYLYNYNFKDPRVNPPKEYSFNLLIRKDPRENNVPVNGTIEFSAAGSTVYVGINDTLTKCKNASRDLASLSSFLTINLFTIKGGLVDAEEAKKNNLTYVSCDKYPNNEVILVQQGSETRIDREDNCYTISIANCESMEAIEKFEIQSILDAKKRMPALS